MELQRSLGEFNPKFNWTQYNASQTREKLIFMRLLRELCNLIEDPKYRVDRKAIPMKDAVFGLGLRVFSNYSLRRFQSDLKLAREAGYVNRDYHFNTMSDHMHHKELRHILRELIEISALPLKQLEQFFAADATGFSCAKFERWFDIRTQKNSKKRIWRKCHAVCGVLSNVVTSVEITDGNVNDTTQFESLINNTAKNFIMKEVSADKGYSSRANMALVSQVGGIPYIPFKSNATGNSRGSIIWAKMYKKFQMQQEEFMKHYHKRSNIESVWSMIKARFGNNLRSKNEESQDNEILLKVLCHNLCVLIQEMFMRNIDVNFLVCAENYVARTKN